MPGVFAERHRDTWRLAIDPEGVAYPPTSAFSGIVARVTAHRRAHRKEAQAVYWRGETRPDGPPAPKRGATKRL